MVWLIDTYEATAGGQPGTGEESRTGGGWKGQGSRGGPDRRLVRSLPINEEGTGLQGSSEL